MKRASVSTLSVVLAAFSFAACSPENGDDKVGSAAAGGVSGGATASAGGGTAGSAVAGSGGNSLTAGAPGAGATAGGAASGGSSAHGGEPGAAGSGVGGAAGGSAGSATSGGASSGSGGSPPSGGGTGGTGAAGAGNAYSPCPTGAASVCAVLPLGDSITEGFGSSGGGYRVELFRQAVQNGKSLTFVGSLQNGPNTVQNQTFPKKHEGHGGYTIDSDSGHSGISGSITQQAIANYHPNIVLLMIGTNDINGNVDIAAAPTRLGKLIDDITTRAPNALVVVATIIPVANDGTDKKVQAYNAAIPNIVSSRSAAGKHVLLLDNYAAFSKDANYRSTLMSDSLHPNDAGYVVLGRAMYDAIKPFVSP